MNPNVITIIALAVDSRNLTLWKQDGSTVVIPQGDIRVARIVNEAKSKGLSSGKPVQVDITTELPKKTEYTDAEKGTGGLVKFFKIAKSKLKEFFADGTKDQPVTLVPHIELGNKSPVESLVEKAMNTFNSVGTTPVEPEMEEIDGNNAKRNRILWITGFDLKHDRISLIKFINDLLHTNSYYSIQYLQGELPIALKGVTEDMAIEYVSRLKQIKGVHYAITEGYESAPDVYQESKIKEPSNQDKLAAASEKLKSLGAIDTDNAEFHVGVKKAETVVAIVGDKVIPGVESLQRHMRQASSLKDYKGFTRFLERVASVVDSRRHSVEDLMKFMECAELPIADDGSILFFKRLNFSEKKGERRVFVDCHSGNIKQWVGCKVQVREDLVDPSRTQDCSNGLHIASMSYLGTFHGDVTIIGKVAPEDVFAVPQYNANKMRVCAYHIIAELDNVERNNVNSGNYLSNTEKGKALLNDVLVGNHNAPTDLVSVGGHKGTKLTYTRLGGNEPVEQVRTSANKTALNMEENLDNPQAQAPVVKATDVKPTKEVVTSKAPTVKEQIIELVKEFSSASNDRDKLAAADLLVELRGRERKPWAALGVSSEIVHAIANIRSLKTKPDLVKKEVKAKTVKSKPAGSSKHANTIRGWLNDSGMSDYSKAHSIHDLKRSAKKSYVALGLTEEECKAIDKLKHHLK